MCLCAASVLHVKALCASYSCFGLPLRPPPLTPAAVSNSRGEFLLNGEFVVSMFKREIKVGSAVIEYSGSDHVIERINCTDRIEEEIIVQVVYCGYCFSPFAKQVGGRSCSGGTETLTQEDSDPSRVHAGALCGESVQPRCQVLLQHSHRRQTSAVLLGRLWALAGVQPPVPR